MESAAHVSANVFCPTGCGRRFVSYSATAIHLESGACSSGVTRDRINYYLQEWDRQGLITTGRRLLPAPSTSSSRNQQMWATEASWSPSDGAYKCYFDNKLFGTLRALNQHLGSPAHAAGTTHGGVKLFRCPNRQCTAEFVSFSGVMSHIERASCGVRSMTQVTRAIEGIMGGMRRLTV